MMRKYLILLAALTLALPAVAEVHQRLYGVSTTINFNLYDPTTGGLDVDEADGGTEVTLYCNEGTGATATNDFVDEGPFYSIALTATEMQCARLAIQIAATDTNVIFVETVGNASALIPALPANTIQVSGTTQTANDDAADINTILSRIVGTLASGTHNPQSGDAYARLGAPAGASHAADLVVIDNFVDGLEAAIGTPSDFGSGTSTIAANLQDLADNGTATFDRSTDSLQAIRDRGDAAWVTGGGGACTADVGCIADGTAQSATSTTIVLASAETFANDELIGATVLINSATAGTGQARIITDYVGSTDTATVDTWTTTPTGTITYRVFGTPPGSTTSPAPVDVRQWIGTAVATPTTAGVPEVDVTFVSGTAQTANDNGADINAILVDTAEIGAAGAGLTNINLPNQTMDITGNLSGSVGSVTGAVGSVTGNVGGNVSGSVGSVTGAVGSVTGAVGSVTGNVGGIAGTITTLDDLDSAQDTQHGTTQTAIDAVPTAAENATEHLTQQRVLTGTCDSGSTTTCVDNALTQANESQLDDRLICFEDSWCALITGFTPGTDTVTTTKAAPSTRASLGYTIFPATAN